MSNDNNKNNKAKKMRKEELSQRPTKAQITEQMFSNTLSFNKTEEEEEEERRKRYGNDSFIKEAAEYFHKHQNFMNKWIHLITMPIIVFCLLCFLANIECAYVVPQTVETMTIAFAEKFKVNKLFYIFMRPTLAHIIVCLSYLMYLQKSKDFFVATTFLVCFSFPAMIMAIACVFAWPFTLEFARYGLLVAFFIQVCVGHGLIERRRPTFATTNVNTVLNTTVFAPLYVWLEVLFGLLLYEPDLADAIDERVDEMNAMEENEINHIKQNKKKTQ